MKAGTNPESDYVWRNSEGGKMRPDDQSRLNALKEWPAPAGESLVMGQDSSHLIVLFTGLRHPSWPRDYQGRPIVANILVVADGPDRGDAARLAAALLVEEVPGDFISFSTEIDGGWTSSIDALSAMTPALPAPSPTSVNNDVCRWTPSRSEAAQYVALLSTVPPSAASTGVTIVAVVSELMNPQTARLLTPAAVVLCGSLLDSRTVPRPKELEERPSTQLTVAKVLMPVLLVLGLLLVVWLIRRK